MEPNPYEAPRTSGRGAKSGTKNGVRLMTVAVFVMLGVLVLTCGVLGAVALWLKGLG